MGRVVGTMCGFKFSVFCKASGTRSSRDALVTYAAEWQWPRLGCACRREDAPTGAAPAAQDNEKPQMQTDEFKTRIPQTNQKYSRSQGGSGSRDLRIRRSDRFLGGPCGLAARDRRKGRAAAPLWPKGGCGRAAALRRGSDWAGAPGLVYAIQKHFHAVGTF